MKNSGRHVVETKSNHELIRTDYGKAAGFSTDFAAAVHVILLADMYELDSLSVGMPLENTFLSRLQGPRLCRELVLGNSFKILQGMWIRTITSCDWIIRSNHLQNC